MKKIMTLLIITGLTGIFSAAALGQTTPGVDRRQRIQRNRVKAGVRSGQVTRREARSIRRSTAGNRRLERRVKAEGRVTWKERSRLHRKENRSSRKIFRAKHNKRNRY